jgi:tetraprenyl-beta-curcumene synthase
VNVVGDTQALVALLRACIVFQLRVARIVRAELERWRDEAARIPDPQLRALALMKLEREGANAAAAAMLATLAPRRRRDDTTRAIVALEVLFDYLDGRTEPPVAGDPVAARRALFSPLASAFDPRPAAPPADGAGDAAYVGALARSVELALTKLQPGDALRARMAIAAERAIEAQSRIHASAEAGRDQLERWARGDVNGAGLDWREHTAGAAASVLVLHALIGCRSDSPAQLAKSIDDAYMHVAALATLLDGVVDDDAADERRDTGLSQLYPDDAERGSHLVALAARAHAHTRALPRGRSHRMILVGMLAFYATAGGARDAPALAALRARYPGLSPAAMTLRAWRRRTLA